MVIRAGWGNTGRALLELADVGIDHEIKDSVASAASKALAGQSFAGGRVLGDDIKVREVHGIKAGQSYLVDVELVVPDDLTVGETSSIEDLVRQNIGAKVRGMRRVKVKFVAKSGDSPDLANEFVSGDANVEEIHEHKENHHHDHHHVHEGNGHTSESEVRKRH